MKRRNNARRVDGILVLDKPPGLTSNAALQRVKGIYFAQKVGHTGSLDPLATGVLPICFGEATKWSQYLLDSDKEYLTTVCLGVTTDTGDADGKVLEERSAAAVDVAAIDAVLPRFRGEIEQVPPMYSALKRNGVPLYELARAGQVVEREARRIIVYSLEREGFEGGERASLVLRVLASKGTYIRVVAEDIGAALGCGAHVATLRRSRAGPFSDADAVSLDVLEALRADRAFEELDSFLLPASRALGHLPEVRLAESSCYYLSQGQAVTVANLPAPGFVRIAGEDGSFRGVGEVLDDRRVAPRRMGAA